MKTRETYRFVEEDLPFRIVNIGAQSIDYVFLSPGKGSYVPKRMSLEQMNEGLYDGSIQRISDPFLDQPTAALKGKNLERSKRNWEWIKELWGGHKSELLDRSTRAKTIKAFARDKNCSSQTVKNLLINFYVRGMDEWSVSTNLDRCGHLGKKRNVSKKPGPKTPGQSPPTAQVEDIFEKSYRKFYLSHSSRSIQGAYEDMIQAFFSKDGKVTAEGKPSYQQFRRWILQQDPKEIIKAKEARNSYELEHRILTSSTNAEVSGPGDVFEIDATPLDCHIVSRSNRDKVIGRPVLYLIVDRYSRLITGMSVGLEGPSWLGAVGAFENMVEDKVAYCKKYGITIEPEDWPVKDLIPYAVVGDRGEMISSHSSALVKNLSVRLKNTPPYRGDLKGNVERSFGVINSKIRERIEGAVLKEHLKRGDSDPRDKAKLNLDEITAVCIHCVLFFNQRLIRDFSLSEDQIAFDVDPRPISLWNYGVDHSLYCYERVDGSSFRQKILPAVERTVGRRGVKLNNLVYTAGDEKARTWLENNQNRKFSFQYDPLDAGRIYFNAPDGTVQLVLADTFDSFKDMTYEEAKRYEELRKEKIKNLAEIDLQSRIDLNERIKQINDSVPGPGASVPKAARKKDVRGNRRLERKGNGKEKGPIEAPVSILTDEQDPLSNYYDVIAKTLRESDEYPTS